MNIEEASELLEQHDDEFLKHECSSIEAFIKGLLIISNWDKECSFSAEHDILYVGGFSEDMPEEDILNLNKFGFHLEPEYECWAKFT